MHTPDHCLLSFFLSFFLFDIYVLHELKRDINSPHKDDGDNFLNKLGKKIKIKELNAG